MDSKTLNSLSGYPDKGVEFRWRCLVSQESHPFKRTSGKELVRAIRTIIVQRGKTEFKAWFGGLACSGLSGYRTCRAGGNA